ncbi:uncharacterized protein [Nicotiana tomentosiformis]|uniref:uncharacterized protein n=1 Tax=Nicotiana tomentosiformis TaxID=4098 RepID=UPI00388C9269
MDPGHKRSIIITVSENARVLSALVGVASYLQFLLTEEDQAKLNKVDVPCLFNEVQHALNRALVLHHKSFLRYRAEVNQLEAEARELAEKRDTYKLLSEHYEEAVKSLQAELDAAEKKYVDLVEQIASIEHERDDLLVVVVDLKDAIEKLKGEGKHEILQKGNEVADKTHLRLEDEIKSVKSSLYVELEKNKQLKEKGTVKGSSKQWYMDSGCSKHITGSTIDFLSLKALQGGSVSFGNGKKGYILGGNKVEFVSKICAVTNLVTSEVVLVAKRYKNIYVADFESLQSGDLTYLSDVDDDAELWHRRQGHASFTLLNNWSRRTRFVVCPSQASRTTRTKDETFQVFVAFVKKIQLKMSNNVVCIRSDHGTEFDNAKFDEFYVENGITYNFSAPRTPQQNGVVETKNRTLEDMERTMLIDSGIAKRFWVEAVNTAC